MRHEQGGGTIEAQSVQNQIEWLISHPATSEWLKAALRSSSAVPPSSPLEEVAMLSEVLQRRALADIASNLGSTCDRWVGQRLRSALRHVEEQQCPAMAGSLRGCSVRPSMVCRSQAKQALGS